MDAGGASAGNLAIAVWANPTRTLTTVQGLVFNQKIQAPVTVGPTSLTGTADTTILTYNATGGMLIAVGVVIGTTFGTGTVTGTLDITIDGNLMSIPLWTASQNWSAGSQNVANFVSGAGGVAGNNLNFQFYFGFATSVLVQLNITATTLSAGTATVSAFYCHP